MRKRAVGLIVGAATMLGTLGGCAPNQAPTEQQPAPAEEQVLVLRGGLLIDGAGGAPLANSVVTISQGIIQSVGSEGSVTIPADATVIDTTGKTIVPGLVDSHIHLRNYQPQAYLYWGVTSVGDLGNSPGWVVAYREAVEDGRSKGPYIMAAAQRFNTAPVPGGPGFVPRQNTFVNGNAGNAFVSDMASIETAVAEVKQMDVDALKMFPRMDPALMKLTAEVAHREGLPVFAHYTSGNTRGLFLSTDEILDTGIDVQVHLFGLIKSTAPQAIVDRIASGEALDAWHLLDTSKFPALAQQMTDRNMFMNPTLRTRFESASRYREEFDRMNIAFVEGPIAAGLPEPIRNRYAVAFKPGSEEGAEQLAEGYRRAGLFVKEFVDAGGKIIAGSDTGAAPLGTAGLSLHEEMMMLLEVGLTPMQVLQSATSWGMEAWGKLDEVGTLEPGKRADVLILNRNPLDDMMATTDIFTIVQGGSVVDREALANWEEVVPRPTLLQERFLNPALHVPFIDQISPELLSVSQGTGSELTITGESFSPESVVLINDRVVSPGSQTENQVQVSIPPELLSAPGVYPLAVVQPGSGGGVSNTYYVMVVP